MYAVICSGFKEEYIRKTQTLLKEKLNTLFDNQNYRKQKLKII